MTNPFNLDDFLPYRLSVLAGRISREYAQAYREKFGLDRAEWRVLAHLSQAEAVSIREIHLNADMDKSKVSRAATRLEASGLIEKHVSASDRRLVELSLTPKGKEMIDALAPLALTYQDDLLARLGADAEPFLRGVSLLMQDETSD